METLGYYLERLGPVFGFLFFVLVIGAGVALVLLSSVRLLRRERPAEA